MSNSNSAYKDYGYSDTSACWAASYLLPQLLTLASNLGSQARVLDVGCGNGFIAGQFQKRGCYVVGVDLSEQGITLARQAHPQVRFEILAADKDVLCHLREEPFDVVISTEVVEHLYDPRAYAAGCFAALRPGGRFICSTPFHGYLKNLVLAAAGKWDSHADPLWDGGHIKLWSRRTLSALLNEAGFENLQFRGAGRVPYLWKSMVMTADRPR